MANMFVSKTNDHGSNPCGSVYGAWDRLVWSPDCHSGDSEGFESPTLRFLAPWSERFRHCSHKAGYAGSIPAGAMFTPVV
jgi:hypothetical protein